MTAANVLPSPVMLGRPDPTLGSDASLMALGGWLPVLALSYALDHTSIIFHPGTPSQFLPVFILSLFKIIFIYLVV